MKYTFDEKIPYEFKDITGIGEDDKIGISIVEDGKVIGGILYYDQEFQSPFKFLGSTVKCITVRSVEIVPEHRNKGKGTEIIKHLLTQCRFINSATQSDGAWAWWKSMGAKEYMAVVFPEDRGNPNAKAHTVAFVLGQNDFETQIFKGFIQMLTSQLKGVSEVKGDLQTDFSVNNIKYNENNKASV